jgi:tetratricopeptide (TPR) repeat protein
MGVLIEPYREEEKIRKEMQIARQLRDRRKSKELELQLVALYIKYGEHFKMSERPNSREAISFLKKALKMIPDHSIGNYRIAHLYYRSKNYENAALHFRNAIESKIPAPLNEIQTYLTQLFLANSGILIAKNIVPYMQELQDEGYVENHPLVEKYRHELLVTTEETIERLYYRKISKTREELIPYEEHTRLIENNPKDTVLLIIDEVGTYYIMLGKLLSKIHFVDFLLLYTILLSEKPVTNTNICEKLINYDDPDHNYEPNEDKIRKEISRLKEEISFWDEMIEDSQIGRKTARGLKQGLKFIVLCKVADQLPD